MTTDVAWIPVSEEPPIGERYFVLFDKPIRFVRTADWYEPSHRWVDECGDDVTGFVTHYAVIVYPPAPEEA